jgi:uncharacterized protein YfaS (alpha-2-macroglobulin family)
MTPRSRFPLLLLVSLAIVGCHRKDAQPPATAATPETTAPGAAQAPPTPEQLVPMIAALGSADRIPDKVVVELARPISSAGAPVGDGTRLSFEPDVAGALEWTGPSTLTFTAASDGFAPATKYLARLESVDIANEVVKAPASGWQATFETAPFRMTSAQLTAFDPEKRSAELQLTFSAPVEANAVTQRLKAQVVVKDASRDVEIKEARTGDDPHDVFLTLAQPALQDQRKLHLALAEGVPMLARSRAKAPSAEADVTLDAFLSTPAITIRSVAPAEGTNGFYVDVVCDDRAAGGARGYWDSVGNSYYEGLSDRCLVQDDSARESIRIEPALPFSIAPGPAGFRIFGDFRRGSYTVHLGRGLASVDGGVLRPGRDVAFSVPARAPRVTFVSKGRYLPRAAWSALPLQHVNVDAVELAARLVPPENLVFWMSDDSEGLDDRNSNLVASSTLKLEGAPDTSVTRSIDVSALVPANTKGLIEVRATSGSATDAVRLVLTDLQLVAKLTGGNRAEPWGQRVHAWVVDASTLQPLSGVSVKLVRKSGQALATGTTRGDGDVTLDVPAKGVDPSPPFALIAARGSDLTYLAFDEVADRVEEARVAGEPFSGSKPYRATVYSDRGVYRPGETAHLVAIVRDAEFKAPPEGLPVKFQLVDPRDQMLRERLATLNPAGLATFDAEFAQFATTGRHEVQLLIGDDVVGSCTFHVEEFVPERMKVDVAATGAGRLAGDPVQVSVKAGYLFGGVPAKHRVDLACALERSTFEPKENSNYRYGTWQPDDAPAASRSLGTITAALDDAGEATLTCAGAQVGTLDGPSRVVATASVFEAGSGRATIGQAAVPLHPDRYYIGLSSRTPKAKAGQPLVVDGVVVDWDGKLVTSPSEIDVELLRLEREQGWYYDEGSGTQSRHRYWRRSREGGQQVTAQGGKFTVTLTPNDSSEAFLVRATAGHAASELQVDGGGWDYWWDGDEGGSSAEKTPEPSKPTWVPLEVPASVEVGQAMTVRLTSPWKARALLTVETDRVLWSEWRDVDAGPMEWSFTPRAFTPNVYATVLLIKPPHLESPEAFVPDRAFGVASVALRSAELRQEVKLSVPKEVRSNSTLDVRLDVPDADGPTFATVAAVDEGILSLTKFKDPEPFEGILRRRALGVETFETIGWSLLIPPSQSSGLGAGDEGLALDRIQSIKPVALWSGLVPVTNGHAEIKLEVPQYRGALRVMAVVAGAKRAGAASAQVVVRDPLTLDVTLPRFLMQGDRAEIPVFVTNVSGSERTVELSLDAEAIDIGGPPASTASPVTVMGQSKTVKLRDGEGGSAVFVIRVPGASGAARLRAVAKSGDLRSVAETEVPLMPDGPRTRTVQRLSLEKGTVALTSQLEGWVPLSERSSFWVTTNPYADAFDHLDYLIHYPYGCIEQTTSTTRPLIALQHLVPLVDSKITPEKLEIMARAGLDRILAMQTSSGGFAYWPGSDEPAWWGTAYATHLLLDAKERQYPVPQDRIDRALAWMEDRIANFYEAGKANNGDWYSRDAEPYMHFVLARAGRARKARAQALLEEIQPRASTDSEAAEQVVMLQAALFMAGDRRYEKELRHPDLTPIQPERRNYWSFYSDRRRRGFLLSTYVDLFGSEGAEPLANLVADGLRARTTYTTQEVVWGVTGLGKLADKGASFTPPVLRADGRVVDPAPPRPGQAGGERTWGLPRASEYAEVSLEVPEKKEGTLYLLVSSDGVRKDATWTFGGEGLRVSRRYADGEGGPIAPAAGVGLGDVLNVVLEIENTSPERIENVALVDRIPAGWEIENPRLGRGQPLGWIDPTTLWEADHVDVRDDRLEVFGHLERGEKRTIAYSVRAVTAGSFALPPVEAEAMYDPSRWARAPGGSVVVSGPWTPVAH